MARDISQKTGDASIDKVGHTASSKFGSDPNAKGVIPSHRDLDFPRS